MKISIISVLFLHDIILILIFPLVQSLNIVCCLLDVNVEKTLNRCCWKICDKLDNIGLSKSLFSHTMRQCWSNLHRGVSLLGRWSISGDDNECILKSSNTVFVNAFEFAKIPSVEYSYISYRVFATTLRIISGILRNLIDPNAAVLYSLKFLQALHDQREVRNAFTLLIKKKAESTEEIINFENFTSVHKINKILFEFIQMFVKPPPVIETWPVTIQLDEGIYNPLIEVQLLKDRLGTCNLTEFRVIQSKIDAIDFEVQKPVSHVTEYYCPVGGRSGQSISNRYTLKYHHLLIGFKGLHEQLKQATCE